MKFLFAGLLLLACGSVAAHELQLASLRFDEGEGGRVRAVLSAPLSRDGQPVTLVPRFDARCEIVGEVQVLREARRVLREWQLHCAQGLDGTSIALEGLDPSTPEALLIANFADGSGTTQSLGRNDGAMRLARAAPESAAAPLFDYLPIGIEHILLGPDHLLFVLGLMLVARARGAGWRLLVAALTAFTLAHSLTLGMAMFGIWGLPPKPVEILIALSIVLLALELGLAPARERAGMPSTLTLRRPWLVAFVFGLLHGFGFAGALSEIGLPEQARGWALFLFNLGVEVGQLLFVLAVTLLLHSWRSLRRLPTVPAEAAVLLLGGIAVYWTLDRAALWLQASLL